MQISVAPIVHEAGRVSTYVAVQRDVTDRNAGGGTPQPREHTLSGPSEGIIIINPHLPDSPIVYANNDFCAMTGYSREEVMGRNCRFLQGPDSDMGTLERLRIAVCEVTPPLYAAPRSKRVKWHPESGRT